MNMREGSDTKDGDKNNSLLDCQAFAEISRLQCRGLTLHRGRGKNEDGCSKLHGGKSCRW